jgi:hypothetical protein
MMGWRSGRVPIVEPGERRRTDLDSDAEKQGRREVQQMNIGELAGTWLTVRRDYFFSESRMLGLKSVTQGLSGGSGIDLHASVNLSLRRKTS